MIVYVLLFQIYSRLTSDQIGWFVEQLQNLEKWLDANMTHFAGVRSPLGSHIQRRAGTPLQTSQLGRCFQNFKQIREVMQSC